MLKISIRELSSDYANDLINVGFQHATELHPTLINKSLQSAGLLPRATKLVAYSIEKKQAIGFLCLNEDNGLINSIKFVFVDPKFRRMGVASKMVNYCLNIARKRGVKKIFLDVEGMNNQLINLYASLGFHVIGTKLSGQGYISDFSRLRIITHTMKGQGYIANFILKESGQLIALPLNQENNKKLFFDIYQPCMGKELIDFFELNPDNIINGYSQIWSNFCFKDVFINKANNAYALIFNRPFFSDATVELNSVSPEITPLILNDLVRLLDKRGIVYVNVILFNVNNESCYQWFKEKKFRLLHFTTMGISL